jgi:6-phosphogluconolactonase
MNGSDRAEPEVVVLPDPERVSDAAAERVAAGLADAVAARGRADWMTTGGSAPGAIYERLARRPLRDRVPWSTVHIWWGDDRFVPTDHPLSNVRLVDDILLARPARAGESGSGESGQDVEDGREPGVNVPAGNVHPFPIATAIGRGADPEACAASYATELRAAAVDVVDGWPAFDLGLIGIGPDGHLLSVFPGSEAFDRSDWAMGIAAPTHVEPHVARVTLNPRVLDVVRTLLVVVHGASKAEIVGRILGAGRDERQLPALVARRPGAVWLLDEAAAAQIPTR